MGSRILRVYILCQHFFHDVSLYTALHVQLGGQFNLIANQYEFFHSKKIVKLEVISTSLTQCIFMLSSDHW